MPFDNFGFQEQARDFVAPQGTDPVLEALVKARAFVAAGWSPIAFSVDADGQKNYGLDRTSIMRGTQFCVSGALWRVYYERGDVRPALEAKFGAENALNTAAQQVGHPTAIHLSAATDRHADVLSLFDRAIAARKLSTPKAEA